MLAAASLPIVALALGEPTAVVVFGALAAVAVIVLHRGNIRRLFRGTENRFHFRRVPSRV
jgi:glycerol-3-phosphate acyltransferase PlsY